MKKSKIIGLILFIAIILIGVIIALVLINKGGIKGNSNELNKIYEVYPTDVYDAVDDYMSSQEYEKMSKREQVKNVGALLEIYESKRIITNLYYDEDSQMYTFMHNHGNIKGALGGVMLKDWDPMFN